MIKTIFVILSLIISVFVIYAYLSNTSDEKIISVTSSPSPQERPQHTTGESANGIFVPYWTVGGSLDVSQFTEVYYFGVAVNTKGLATNEAGFTTLPQFVASLPEGPTTFLTIRMLNFDVNSEVLAQSSLQEKIIQESIDLAKEYSFSGIVLDFEMNGLAFDSFVASINNFYNKWYTQVKDNDLDFYITIYGDVFYRARPYDVEFLGKNADKLLIMAYDFHKARGNPGPNFPLSGRERYGYDLEQMTNDFLQVVPSEKLVVVFGLFGYDWETSAAGTSITSGKALSFNQIKSRFIDTCSYNNCIRTSDSPSSETKIEYSDDGVNHIVWFEDNASVAKKKAFLEKMGISSFAFWSYTYF